MNRTLMYSLCLWGSLLPLVINGQDIEIKNQIIRGQIVDRTTGQGLENAYVELLNYTPKITALSLENGAFELKNVPVGHQRIRVEIRGYYETVYSEYVVAGKQSVITIAMDEEVSQSIVVVEAEGSKRKDKGRYRNAKTAVTDEMNTVSVHAFNIEEVTKYVGGYGDPARTLTNFPGLYNIDDTQNYIVSRGNSPYGIQWMVEGVPIENPHHFATMGNTGSIFTLLNNNLLGNSDFVNGALSAQYHNVYSGIFDVKMRRGNNERFEFTAQLSTLGAEFVAEGPFKKKGASFAIALRTGIFDLLQVIGADIGSNAIPRFYDANLKIDIPTKRAGHFSIFGFGGLSDVDILDAEKDTSDLFAEPNIDLYVNNGLALVGIKHVMPFDKQTSLTTTLSYLLEDGHSYRDSIQQDTIWMPHFDVKNFRQRIGLSSILNKKFTPKFVLKTGVHAYLHFISIWERWLQRDETKTWAEDIHVLTSAFVQGQYKFSSRLVLTLGVQGMYWSLNKDSWAVEPRLAFNWYIGKRHKLSLGYGWHSKIQTFPMSFLVKKLPDGSYDQTNRALGPTRSHHLVLSYDVYLTKFWGIRSNIYAQYTTNIAVQNQPSSISLANYGATSLYPDVVGWQSTGTAFSYGAELSIEKYFSHGYYGLVSGTYQRAFYRASDLVWRNSAFDAQYIANMVVGKEFKIGKQKRNALYGDLRFNLHGGLPYVPVDLEASKIVGREVLDYSNAYNQRLGIYKRIDLRLGIRINHRKKRISHHIYVEVINLANFKNDLTEVYDPINEEVIRTKQFGFVPNLFYQIRF